MSALSRDLLIGRYHDAIRLMDEKLNDFYRAATASGLLRDTLLVVTSDHGEAFGDHDLYLHDASVYETHLRIPLFIQHPDLQPEWVEDVVSLKDLFHLFRSVAAGDFKATILDKAYRAENPIAYAAHFHYPHVLDPRPEYQHDLTAVIGPNHKAIRRGDVVAIFNVQKDPGESETVGHDLTFFRTQLRREGVSARTLGAALDGFAMAAP